MKIGYIRVSKQEQNEVLQRDALKEAGCSKYFSDKMTGATFERKGLKELLAFVRSGDTVVAGNLIAWDAHSKILSRPSTSSKIEGSILSPSLRALTQQHQVGNSSFI